ncbi:MAG: transglycosylase domain-containing protein [Patescibacteria group bacterium]
MAKKGNKKWLKISIVMLLILLGFIVFALSELAKIAKELPDPKQLLDSHQIKQSSKIYDRTGEILLYEIYNEEKRTIVSFEEMPDYIKKATISIEDKNFYNHIAFDWRAILRAFKTNILEGRVAQGGSTITQQLAKNTFLTPERTIKRKIKELILSYWIEKKYSKDEILALYLNTIPYGSNAYGVESASQIYFNKPAKELSLAEAALIASLPQAPTYYSPWGFHIDELIQRKNYVLKQMFEMGFIDNEEFERAKNSAFSFADQNIGSIKAPHFVMMVREYLVNKYGEDFIKKGGLKITTTLDYNLQQIAERVVGEGAKRNEELYKGKNASLVAQNPKNGEILALVGSRDYFDKKNEGNFNVAVQGLRQPGSAFKPFTYIAAFKKGLSPDTIIFDLPTEFAANNPQCPPIVNFNNHQTECYHPENYDKIFRGPVNLRDSLAQSLNIPAVKTLYIAGVDNVIKTARDFGINTLTDSSRYGLSLVLGGGEIKLIDIVGAYSVFSQDGIKHNQKIIVKIENNQRELIESSTDYAVQVIEPQYAQMINDILSDEEARKPLYSGSFGLTVFQDKQVAMKTGTTDDYRDAWTIGYSPNLAVGVWAGNNRQEPMQKNAGSILAALPIWNAFMKEALNKFPDETFTKVPSLINNKEGTQNEEKTMLNGNYLGPSGVVHNILYYIDKNDILGQIPQNPGNDPQYINWELSVQMWLQTLK